jgi:hypothetical protein
MTAFWLLRALSAPVAGRVAGIQPPQSIEITNPSRRRLSKAAADQLQRNHGPMARTRKPGTHARPAAGGVPWQANSGRRSAGATRAQTIVCLPRQRGCTLGSPAGRVRATAPLARGAVCSVCPSALARLPPGDRSQRHRTRVHGLEACWLLSRPQEPGHAVGGSAGFGRGQWHTEARETVSFGCLRRKAFAKYRMPAPVAIGYKQDFELTAWREGGSPWPIPRSSARLTA